MYVYAKDVKKMGAIWKFKKVEYLSAEDAARQLADYLMGENSENYKILLQKVGEEFRVQWIKIKK